MTSLLLLKDLKKSEAITEAEFASLKARIVDGSEDMYQYLLSLDEDSSVPKEEGPASQVTTPNVDTTVNDRLKPSPLMHQENSKDANGDLQDHTHESINKRPVQLEESQSPQDPSGVRAQEEEEEEERFPSRPSAYNLHLVPVAEEEEEELAEVVEEGGNSKLVEIADQADVEEPEELYTTQTGTSSREMAGSSSLLVSEADVVIEAKKRIEEQSRKARCELYMTLIAKLHSSGVISAHTREKLTKGILEEDENSFQTIDEKTHIMKEIAKLKSRMADSAANHEGYLQKLPQSILKPGSKPSKQLKQSGVWKRRFFVLKPESFQLVYFENHKSSVFHGQTNQPNSDALGEIDLENGFHFADIATMARQPKVCRLILGTRLLCLKADSELEMEMWLEAFSAVRTLWQQKRNKKDIGAESSASEEEASKLKFRIRQGILVKRGEFRRTWLARYFRLDKAGISYYTSQSDEKPRRTIKYEEITGKPGVKLTWIRNNAFKVDVSVHRAVTGSISQRTYYMMARNAEERDEWISDISHNIWVARIKGRKMGITAMIDENVGQRGRALVSQLYAKGKRKMRRRSLMGDHLRSSHGNGKLYADPSNLKKKVTRLMDPKAVPSYEFWNYNRDNLEDSLVTTTNDDYDARYRKAHSWAQLELWIRADAIVVSQAYYARIMTPSRRLARRVSKVFNSKSNVSHSSIKSTAARSSSFEVESISIPASETDSKLPTTAEPQSEEVEDSVVANLKTTVQNTESIGIYVKISMSTPSTAHPSLQLRAAEAGKLEFEPAGRTEESLGTVNPKFSVRCLIDFPLDETVTDRCLSPLQMAKKLGRVSNNDNKVELLQTCKIDRVVQFAVKVRPLRTDSTTEEYGRTYVMVSQLVSMANNAHSAISSAKSNNNNDVEVTLPVSWGSNSSTYMMDRRHQDAVHKEVNSLKDDRLVLLPEGDQSESPPKISTDDGTESLSPNVASRITDSCPQLRVAPRWGSFVSKELTTCRDLCSQGYTLEITPSENLFRSKVGKISKISQLSASAKQYNRSGKSSESSVMLSVREELTEGSTTFETPTAWIKLRLKEWLNDMKMAENKLASLELEAVGASSIIANKRRHIKGQRSLIKRLKQISERYTTLADTYWVLHKSAMNCDKRGWQPLTFKSSKKKGDKELAFVPTNMHVQLFSVSAHQTWMDASLASSSLHRISRVYDFVTVGLSAAHALGFDEDGLDAMRHMLRKEVYGTAPEQESQNSELGDTPSSEKAGSLDSRVSQLKSETGRRQKLNAMHKSASTLSQDEAMLLHESKLDNIDNIIEVRLREDMVFSQMLSAVIEAFRTKLYLAAAEAKHANANEHAQYDGQSRLRQLETMFRAGFLVQLESLVSTQGAEQGMLDDAVQAIESLKKVELVVVSAASNVKQQQNDVKVAKSHTFEGQSIPVSRENEPGSVALTTFQGDRTDSSGSGLQRRLSFTHPTFQTLFHDELETQDKVPNSKRELPDNHGENRIRGKRRQRHSIHSSIPHLSMQLALPSKWQRVNPKTLTDFTLCHQFVLQDIRYMSSNPASASCDNVKISRRPADDLVNPGGILVTVTLPRDIFEVMPRAVSNPCLVVPLMFTQGINEKQNIAVVFGSTSSLQYQQSINRRNLQRLQRYFACYNSRACEVGIEDETLKHVEYTLGKLSAEIATSKLNKKNFRVLMLAADLVREIGGARITSCKSAKDRTSMAVTHEEVSFTRRSLAQPLIFLTHAN